MSEYTDAAKQKIALAKAGDRDAMLFLRQLLASLGDADVPDHIVLALIEYAIRLQDDFQESN